MKFLYGNLYKKYWPIKNKTIFYKMSEKEYDVLIKWIKNSEDEILRWNNESYMRATKHM